MNPQRRSHLSVAAVKVFLAFGVVIVSATEFLMISIKEGSEKGLECSKIALDAVGWGGSSRR
jgi:hypothetical protein